MHKTGSAESHGSNRRRWRVSSVAAIVASVAALTLAGAALAADAASGAMPTPQFQLGRLIALLFLMLGPIKIIGPFLTVTRGADPALVRGIALRATLFASLALLVAAFIGERVLGNYGIPLPVLGLAGGLILFLVALQGILAQFAHIAPPDADAGAPPPAPAPTMRVALTPIAFPTIVTPYGIAAVIVFLAFSPDLQGQLAIGGAVLAIMAVNLVTMLLAARMLPVLAVALPILGAVFGVIQVAVGLQIIFNALTALGVL